MKKPIAILINEKNKFYLSEKIDLIEYRNLKIFKIYQMFSETKKNLKFFIMN